MKKLLIFFIFILPIQSISSQDFEFPIDSISGEIVYSGIVDLQDLTREELFLKANEWIANYFKSSKDVIQFADKESGKIIAKGIFDVNYKVMGMITDVGYISFTIDLSVKDGKYRYIIKDFWHHNGSSAIKSPGDLRIEKSGFQLSKKAWVSIKEQMNKTVNDLISSLYDTMDFDKDTNADW